MNSQDTQNQLQPQTKISLKELQEIVPLKYNLKLAVIFKEISDKILTYMQMVPNLENFKLDYDFILMVCKLIETLCKPKYKLDKLALLLETMKRVCSLSEDEEKQVIAAVNHHHRHGKIVGDTTLKKSKRFFLSCIKP